MVLTLALSLPGLLKPRAVLTAPAFFLKKEGATIGEAFAGEEFTYRVGFWVFDDVAEAKIRLSKDPESSDYIVTLKAHTTGLIAWLREREDVYTARLREVDGGKRFVTVTFEKNVKIGSKTRRTRTVLDHEDGLMTWKKWKRGKERKGKGGEFEMVPGVFYDGPLTAFYNFRYGVYGQVGEGKDFKITTFPKDGGENVDITLKIATEEEYERRKPDWTTPADYLADVRLDKDLFDSRSGKVEMLFNGGLVPVEAVAKDILFFGDVRGKLVELGVDMDFEKAL
ncbi:MAG: DUF3108 domain-containing protein [Thermodesulfobacteriota bacterium]